MQQIRIAIIGKRGEPWLEEALQEYVKRLQPYLELHWSLLRDDEQLIKWATQQRRLILLDPAGKLMDSPQFSSALMREMVAGGSQVSLAIGGANGFPEAMRSQYSLWSLSPLTFSHRLTRLVLVEQIYLAVAIAQNLPYPR
jgi:23S rRNA (pseudouridine1915-N3)-methyltransferase